MTRPLCEFNAAWAIDGFEALEKSIKEAMRFVPYCEAHREVWSPIFAECVLNACSQLDSLWRAEARLLHGKNGSSLTITDYFKLFRKQVTEGRWVLFWGETGEKVAPFLPWEDSNMYMPLPWWQAYTKLKHDRWGNVTEGTFERCVHAAAALFLGICRSGICCEAVVGSGWPSWDILSLNPMDLVDETHDGRPRHLVLETGCFTYPREWCQLDPRSIGYIESASPRFQTWLTQQQKRNA